MILFILLLSCLFISLLIQGSLEELFVRQEFEGNTTYTEIVDWLTGPKRSQSSYRNTAIILSEPFRIRDAADKLGITIEDADAWRNLKGEVDLLGLNEPKTRKIIQTNLDKVEELEKEEVEEKEQLIAEEESRKFLLGEYKEAKTVEEEKQQRKELKEDLPYSLRSLKGWETRRGKEAFRAVFG